MLRFNDFTSLILSALIHDLFQACMFLGKLSFTISFIHSVHTNVLQCTTLSFYLVLHFLSQGYMFTFKMEHKLYIEYDTNCIYKRNVRAIHFFFESLCFCGNGFVDLFIHCDGSRVGGGASLGGHSLFGAPPNYKKKSLRACTTFTTPPPPFPKSCIRPRLSIYVI